MMTKKILIAISVFMFLGCASAPVLDFEALESIEEKPAYVVFKLGKKSRYIKRLVFRHVETEANYAFNINRREGEVVVLSVPKGSYYLASLKTHMIDKQAVLFKKPARYLSFSPGKTYYLGDLSWRDESVVVDFSKESVLQALDTNHTLIRGSELFVYNHLFGDASIASVTPRNVPSLRASESFDQIPCHLAGSRNLFCTN